RQFVEVTRPRGAEVAPPKAGDPVLIDPRHEDPLEMMGLDLDTFRFLPKGSQRSRNYQRAQYTIDLLCLNSRPELPMAREEAYKDYSARLEQYITAKQKGKPASLLQRYRDALKRMRHPTVWQEMKRQQSLIPELRALFAEAPEALKWYKSV